MFTFPARRLYYHKNVEYISFCRYILRDSAKAVMSSVKYPWSYIYISGPDLPVYFKRGRVIENESESKITKNKSQILRESYIKYLLFAKRDSACDVDYVESSIKSHLAYRQKAIWPATSFCHTVLFDDEVLGSGSNGRLQRGVLCCCMSQDQNSHLLSLIKDFLVANSNFVAYTINQSSCKNVYKMSAVVDVDDVNDSGSNDDQEIEIELVTRPAMTDMKKYDALASPVFLLSEISPVFHSYSEARTVLQKLSGVPEVKELLDITDKCVTIAAEKTCDQSLLHPFVVVEGMDATGKTTLTELLEKKLGAARYFTPPPQITQLRAFFDKYPEIVRRAYYSMGNYIVAQEIIQECQSRPVIMDRFWHSTAAYGIANETSSGDMPEPDHWVYKWPTDLLKPTIVLFLTVSEDVRKKRLCGRGVQATFEEKSLDNDQLFRERLCDAYRRMNSPSCVEIDAGGTVEEVQNKAIEVLASHGVNLGHQ